MCLQIKTPIMSVIPIKKVFDPISPRLPKQQGIRLRQFDAHNNDKMIGECSVGAVLLKNCVILKCVQQIGVFD